MNIIEAFLKFKKQYIILVSGLSGSGKLEIAELLSRELKFRHVKLEDYFKKQAPKIAENTSETSNTGNTSETSNIKNISESINTSETSNIKNISESINTSETSNTGNISETTITENTEKVLNTSVSIGGNIEDNNCCYELIDWNLFNKYVNENKHEGIVCSGMIFDKTKLLFHSNYSIHLQISKQQWFESIKKTLSETISNPEELEIKFTKLKKILNNDCYTYYLDKIKILKANKFINIIHFNEEEISHEVWDALMKYTGDLVNK